jgi:glycosyltransferase involved in cell wall biosynthesis
VRLIAHGRGQDFHRTVDEAVIAETLRRLGVQPPFVLSVARGYEHKNLAGLLHAFARVREASRRNLRLVLVGDRFRAGTLLTRLVARLRLGDGVIFTGRIRGDDLNVLYSAASVFAFPSLAEGFGLPVLEAMSCGAPVVASSASAISETVGEAGLLADARDPDDFAEAIAHVLDDDGLQAELRTKGLSRAQEFSWERCAERTLAVYREFA